MAPLELRERTTYILVKLAPGADAEAVRREIRLRLPYNDVRTRAEWSARSRSYWVTNTGLGLSMYVTVFLGCLVGVIVVAQTLHTSTLEHVKEFATVKALGGTSATIFRVIAEQALLAALFGFAAGCLLAYAARPLLARMELVLILLPEIDAQVFAGTVVLCLAAATIPFRKVAALDPASILRG
jgi:putative ABC transport system permease protein